MIGFVFFWVIIEVVDVFVVELYDKISIYGEFDKEDECWMDGLENFIFFVFDDCILVSIK